MRIFLLAVGVVFICTGILGVAGKDIYVLQGRGGGLKLVTGAQARFVGGVYLLMGCFAIGAGLGWF